MAEEELEELIQLQNMWLGKGNEEMAVKAKNE